MTKKIEYKTIKQGYIDFYLAGGNPLFLPNGSEHRGGSMRCAFWDGFNGLPRKLHTGMAGAAWDAGKYCARHYK